MLNPQIVRNFWISLENCLQFKINILWYFVVYLVFCYVAPLTVFILFYKDNFHALLREREHASFGVISTTGIPAKFFLYFLLHLRSVRGEGRGEEGVCVLPQLKRFICVARATKRRQHPPACCYSLCPASASAPSSLTSSSPAGHSQAKWATKWPKLLQPNCENTVQGCLGRPMRL